MASWLGHVRGHIWLAKSPHGPGAEGPGVNTPAQILKPKPLLLGCPVNRPLGWGKRALDPPALLPLSPPCLRHTPHCVAQLVCK